MGPHYYLMWPEAFGYTWPGEYEQMKMPHHNNNIIARHEWRAKKALFPSDLKEPITTYRIRFTETDQCFSMEECMRMCRAIQLEHIRMGHPDIQYSFLIGGDDFYYEGAGWNSHVKDISKPESEQDDKSFIYLGLIAHSKDAQDERHKLRIKHMEKLAIELFHWGVRNDKMQGYMGPINMNKF